MPVTFKCSYHYNDNMLEIVNPHVVKIVLVLKEGDSIRHISRKAGTSYG